MVRSMHLAYKNIDDVIKSQLDLIKPIVKLKPLGVLKEKQTKKFERREKMSIKKIACCTDFSDNAEISFAAALDLAQKYNAKLNIIHVLPPVVNPLMADVEWSMPYDSQQSLVLKLEEEMQNKYGSRIGKNTDYKLVVLDGHISTEILTYIKENNIDLVVMGAYGLSGMGLVLFGSVAKRIAHKAPCSVMIVRS